MQLKQLLLLQRLDLLRQGVLAIKAKQKQSNLAALLLIVLVFSSRLLVSAALLLSNGSSSISDTLSRNDDRNASMRALTWSVPKFLDCTTTSKA